MASDVYFVFQWWGTLFLIGAAAYPLTRALFPGWYDRGYLFTKAAGLATVTFLVYLLGTLRMLPFTQGTVWFAMGVVFVAGVFWNLKTKREFSKKSFVFFFEELFFFAALLFWSWIKAHEPSIHGLEKFMDFGFTKAILAHPYFPTPDMWYAGATINYYYFGHVAMAALTRLSGIDLAYTFNLMLATIFAFTLTMSFSIGRQLVGGIREIKEIGKIAGGLLTAFLVTLAGNMQTVYAFTRGYPGDQVKPFWELMWKIDGTLLARLGEGMNRYWYANATRFIPYTIHEFPSYSFVVSDVHGHVLSLPFVLLAIALLIAIFENQHAHPNFKFQILFYGFLCGVLLMTNALDGPIYFGLLFVTLVIFNREKILKQLSFAAGAAIVTSLPFVSHFKSFVSGIAVNCPVPLLSDMKIGPILFEGVEKCQHSPLWMMWLLWGFFIYCGIWLVVKTIPDKKMPQHVKLLIIFFVFSLGLIIFPEFLYFKDIYPMHFRSNTMFKLGYQAFIMFSIVSGYAIVTFRKRTLFMLILIPQLFLVAIFPIFSVRSYFGNLTTYQGLNGLTWLQKQYPDNFAAITWLNTQKPAVIVEADGDSYTDYDQFSAFTGFPTIVGWPVHEWLWRGSYDVVSPRREEVRRIYESKDVAETRRILEKYRVQYIIVGSLEQQKYRNLNTAKFAELGKIGFRSGNTTIYLTSSL